MYHVNRLVPRAKACAVGFAVHNVDQVVIRRRVGLQFGLEQLGWYCCG